MKLHYCAPFILLFGLVACKNEPEKADYKIQGVPFNEVKINDQFWRPKIETNRTVTIPASFAKCEEMGRMDNFLIAGGKIKSPVKGKMPFDDTDVYKIIEGAAYSITVTSDPKLDHYLDSIINIIKIGQESDGYLTTYKTIDTLLKVFGEGKNPGVPGHQIVETGLIKLYQVTGKKDYLKLARHFLDFRGDSTKRKLWGSYNQDHKPVTEQDEAVGHAVRATYMYAGMTDIAALFDDAAYTNAVDKIWDNIVYKKLYLTGGLGALHQGEAFGKNYELPNLTAYNETCAAIANVYWTIACSCCMATQSISTCWNVAFTMV